MQWWLVHARYLVCSSCMNALVRPNGGSGKKRARMRGVPAAPCLRACIRCRCSTGVGQPQQAFLVVIVAQVSWQQVQAPAGTQRHPKASVLGRRVRATRFDTTHQLRVHACRTERTGNSTFQATVLLQWLLAANGKRTRRPVHIRHSKRLLLSAWQPLTTSQKNDTLSSGRLAD